MDFALQIGIPMSSDPWRAWQSWAALLTPPQAPRSARPDDPLSALLGSAERFASAAGRYTASLGTNPSGAAGAAQAFSEFLRDEFASLFVPFGAAGADPGRGFAAAAPSEAPALGPAREHQERAQRAAAAWQRLDDAQRRLQRLWADALREAAAAFTQRLTAAPPTGAEDFQRLYDTWIDCAEQAYGRTAHSQAFCDALADHANAGSDWRRETRAGAVAWAKIWDLPTRSEINSLAERLRSVEEALRAQNPPRRSPRRKPRAPRGKAPP
jgi:hypothetical protein